MCGSVPKNKQVYNSTRNYRRWNYVTNRLKVPSAEYGTVRDIGIDN
jgi:hypothetical protein